MSYSWNAWACIVDDQMTEKGEQIEMLFAEMEKKDKQIERLERQNWDLHHRARRLEEANQSTERSDSSDDSDTAQIQHREEDDSTLNPAIVELHGGYSNPKPHPERMPMPVRLPTFAHRPLHTLF